MAYLRISVTSLPRARVDLSAYEKPFYAGFWRRCYRYISQKCQGAYFLGQFGSFSGDMRCDGKPDILNQGSLRIGDGLRCRNEFAPINIDCSSGAVIEIGTNVSINYGVLIQSSESILIGNNVKIGNLCVISDTHFPRQRQSDNIDQTLPIVIEDDVWLAARVIVLPGSRICRGAVISAGSIVSGIIPPDVTACGIPARPLLTFQKPPVA